MRSLRDGIGCMCERTVQTMSELKPCPFCGGKARINKNSFYEDKTKGFTDHSYGVECLDCFTQSFQFYKTEEQAVKDWNRRADNDR